MSFDVKRQAVPAGNLNRKQRRARKQGANAGSAAAHASVPPGKLKALVEQAIVFQKSKAFEQAKEIYDKILPDHQDNPRVLSALAGFYEHQKNWDEAYALHKRAVTLNPGNTGCWHAFSLYLREKREYEAALLAMEKVVELKPDNSGLLVELGQILALLFELDRAMAAFDRAVELAPENDAVHLARGGHLVQMGKFDEARKAFDRTLELNPGRWEAYDSIIAMRGEIEDPDTVLAIFEKTIADPATPSGKRSYAGYAMARLYERTKNHDAAFGCYVRANREIALEFEFDWEKHSNHVDELIEVFTPQTFVALDAAGTPSNLPVFVVGMPRSGTTLVEQIIASHSQAYGAGELIQLPQIDGLLCATGKQAVLSYPKDITRLDSGALARMGADHLSFLRRKCSADAERIVDKMPPNFFLLGLIATLFPNASIINCVRDPMDTCVSCFTQNFADKAGLSFTFAFDRLGFYYRLYRRLMDHWHKVLPIKILDVRYEELIENQEQISRQMIDHIGLDWEDACLRFHEQDHKVSTASLWQVRQPIYKTSAGRWRDYEQHLGDLIEALGEYAPAEA